MRGEGLGRVMEEVMAARTLLLVCHTAPEGDCIGSALALFHALQRLDKRVSLYEEDPIPANLMFLPGAELFSRTIPENARYDAVVAVDCADLPRVGRIKSRLCSLGLLLNIDHHASNDLFGTVNWVVPDASSAGELIYHLIRNLGVAFEPAMAVCLYTAVLVDTGCFRFSNTSAEALRIAAEMVRVNGFEPSLVAENLYERLSVPHLRALALTLSTLEVDGGIACITVTKKMMEETKTSTEEIDGFINYPRAIEGVELAVQFKEVEPETYKVSLRSKRGGSAGEVARRFGGGGHPNAAACLVKGVLPVVKRKVLSLALEIMSAGNEK